MSTFRLTIVFTGVDFDDDEVFDALDALSNVTWRSQGRLAFATAVVDAPNALKAAELVTHQVAKLVPSSRPVRLDDDLVAIPDVAGRVGLTREAVRNWANGTRHAHFPLPRGVVGDGIKVWAWSDVSGWLRENLGLGDSEKFPSQHDAAVINGWFADAFHRKIVTRAAGAMWSVGERIRTSTETTVPRHPEPRPAWIPAASERRHLSAIGGA